MNTAQQLQTVATLWADLTDALGDRTQHAWPPPQLRDYLAGLDRYDLAEAAALRALERSPDQLGTRPVPISLRVLDTMRTVEAVLHDTADQIAAESQRDPMQPAPATWPTKDRIRRNRLANADANHPHRWKYKGRRPGAIHTALWLSARAAGTPWPGRPLTDAQTTTLATVATGALARIERALDLADGRRELTAAHPCQCGGAIEIRGGAGAQPTARCKQCGALWSERGVVAA
ncbi:hypothetical protein ACN9M0_24875 [Streptomyces sp. R-07]|uniref:hypothetical protein n=1 Tax=Streptomyces sp. R-07 TaxID=3404052 RepID=UPI003CF2330F